MLDSPGIIPARQLDQDGAVRLAICNDIGEVLYSTNKYELYIRDFIAELLDFYILKIYQLIVITYVLC